MYIICNKDKTLFIGSYLLFYKDIEKSKVYLSESQAKKGLKEAVGWVWSRRRRLAEAKANRGEEEFKHYYPKDHWLFDFDETTLEVAKVKLEFV